MVAVAATHQFAEAIIPLRGEYTLVLFATVTLARSLVTAMLVSVIVVIPLVIVYQRYAPLVATVLCIPVIALEATGQANHAITSWLVGADLVFLVAALVGFAGLVSRKGTLGKLSFSSDLSPAALNPPPRRYRVVAILAALVGLFAFTLGLYAVVTQGVSTEGYWLRTEVFEFLFATAALVAAVALYRLRRWGGTLWIALCGTTVAVSIPLVPSENTDVLWGPWVVLTCVFVCSLWALWQRTQTNENAL
jgi:hypothetical protein